MTATLIPFAEFVRQVKAQLDAEVSMIVNLRRVGLGGGQGCRLRYTPPDVPPQVGSLIEVNGDAYKVVSVEAAG